MDYSYAKSRKESYRASNQGSSTDRLDATRKTLGATQRGDGSDYGFEWLNGGYDWASSRREEYGMSRRDATEGWDEFGATMRDDIGNPRRDNLGRTMKENLGATRRVDLGATGDTRREDFGASAADGIRATGGNPARDSRSDNLEMPYYRQLQDTGNYRASRQTSPTPVTYPSVEPYDYAVKESDYSVNDGQETDAGKPRRWTSVAADRDLMQEWHAMFGQIRTKWAPSSGLDDPATVSKWSDGKSSSNGNRPRRNLRIALVVAVVAVVVLVAVVVPTLLFTLGKDEEKEVLVQYEYSAKITNREYSADMANSSSEAFRDIENEFCGQLDQTAATKSIVDFTYNGCSLKEIKNGSLIIIYIAVIKVSRSRDEALPTAVQVSVSLGITVAAPGEQSVGVFTVVTVAVTIVQPFVITESQNPVKTRIPFNGTCSNSINERCITKRSQCIDNFCKCPVDRSHVESPDTCTQIDCGDHPIINNGTVTSNGTKYGSALNITCDEGFELSDNTTIYCTSPGSWRDMPSCLPVECPEFITPNSSEVDTNITGRAYTDVINITCVMGYTLDSNLSSVTCLANQSWSVSPVCSVVTCMPFDKPDNAGISPHKQTYEYNDNVTVDCDTGHQVQAAAIVRCQPNGTWTVIPTCDPVDCELLTIPNNGGVSQNKINFVYNETANIECDSGYQLQGIEMIGCQPNGTWKDIPKCEPVDCDQLKVPYNGAIVPNQSQFIYKENVTIECDTGYQLQGNEIISCETDGTWKDIPKCEPVDCDPLTVPDNAANDPDQNLFVYKDNVTIECDSGYQLQGNEIISYETDGTWKDIPKCEPVDCDSLTVPDNAAIHPDERQFVYKDNVTIECDTGYQLQGKEIIRCQADGTWKDIPKCEPVDCDPLTVPDNAANDPDQNLFVYKENVTIECDSGYQLQGNEMLSCETDGTWNEIPTCDPIECVFFELPDKSNFQLGEQQYTFNDTVNLECEIGYEIQGNPTVRCQSNASWTEIPTCNPINCSALQIHANAEPDSDMTDLNFDDAVFITCESGFILVGDSNISCNADGTWPKMSCVAVNCSTEDFTNPESSIVSNVNDSASAVEIDCVEGYTIVGNSTVYCISGNWSEFPYCEKVKCGMYGFIENGNISSQTGTEYGDTVEIKCAEHFKLIGENQGTCLSSGSWTEKPVCKQIECEIVRLPENAAVPENINDTIAGTVITLVCRDGYDLNGPGNIICQDNETWSATPMCIPKDCGQPGEIEKSNLIGFEKTTFNNSFAVECIEGYNLIGEPNVYCQENGSWTDNPSCEIKDCGQIDAPDNGNIVNQTGTTVGSITYIKCNTGFDTVGKENLTCLTTGNWDYLPSCQKTDCGEYTPPEHTAIGPNNTIICSRGYDLTGEAIIECLNGSWSVNGECELVQCSDLPKIDNANLTANADNTYYFEDTIDVLCNYGFEISGDSRAQCGLNKTWVYVPSCNPVHCNTFHVPPDAEIGDQETTGRVFGDIINVTCSIGFDLKGDSLVVCNASGEWENDPSCDPVDCELLTIPNNGGVSPNKINFVYNETAIIECDPGYQLQGIEMIGCQPNGTWKDIPKCEPVDCDQLKVPYNGAIVPNQSQFIYKENVTIECDTGYQLQGNEIISCETDGTWKDIPKCEPVDCDPLTVPDNAANDPDQNLFVYKENVTIECDAGYQLQGNEIISCETDGTWKDIPKCEPVDCDPLTVPDNAAIHPDERQFVYRENVTIECDTGYQLQGNEIISCETDGSWNEIPTCDPIECVFFELPDKSNFQLGEQQYTFNDTVNLECEIGYEIQGNPTVRCQSNASWTEIPTCNPINCSALQIPANAEPDSDMTDLNFDNAVFITCESGFILVGDSNISCNADGTWPKMSCVAVNCSTEDFTNPESSIVSNVNDSASAVEIDCVEGYTIVGNSTVYCISGNWSEFPYCEKVKCGMYGFVENGNISSQTGTEYGDTVEIKCAEHFKLIGENQGTCLSSGSWTEKPMCKQIECEIVRLPENADVPENINDTIAGTVITLVCRDGYDLNGPGNIICQDNETWSATPMCIPKDCGQPDEIDKSNLIGFEKTTFNNSFAVECIEGYNLIGEPNVYCQENGSWTDNPSCEIKDCGQIDAPDNGNIVNQTGTTVGSITYIKCKTGFDIVGKENLTCLTTGNWDNLPSCQKTDCGEYTPPEHTNIGTNNTIICNRGYDLTGDAIIECLNGSWSVNGKCELVQCSDLPNIDNANLTANVDQTFYFEDTIYVLCNYGFEISGDSRAQCGENKTWVHVPSCNPSHCNTFPVPTYAEIGDQETTNRVFGDIINVTCSIGFDLEGDGLVLCNASGEWENDPSCKPKTCPSFEVPSNTNVGQQKLTGYTYGDVINVTCNEGYFSADGLHAICGSDGEWENTPNCFIVSCPEFTQPEYSKPIMLNGTVSTLEIECFEGYIITGSSSVTCIAGNWTEFPTCEIINCGPYGPSGETYSIESNPKTTYNTSLSVTCVDGLELTNDSAKTVSCEADGQWNGHIDCKIPGSISFTQNIYMFEEGESEQITCEVKDYPRWQTILLTKVNPEENIPITTIVILQSIFMISNATGSVNNRTFNTDYTVDYKLENEGVSITLKFNNVTCNNAGLYTCITAVGDPENAIDVKPSSAIVNVSCIDCGMHEPITDTYVVEENGKTTVNSSLPVTCVDGLELTHVSVKVVTCEADGNWHGGPDCEIPGAVSFTQTMYAFAEGAPENITCEVKDYSRWQTVLLAKADPEENGPTTPIFMISNVTGSVNSTTFNLNFTADYTLENDGISVSLIFNTVTCDNEGMYTCAAIVGEPENPTAMKSSNTTLNVSCVDCGMPIIYKYVVDEHGKTTFNSSLSVTCVDGLEFSNVSVKVVTCEADGNWHGQPDCEIPGAVSFTQTMYAFAEGAPENITCEVKDYPRWQTVQLAKVDPEENGPITPILMISNVTGSVNSTTFNLNFTADYTLENDGISVSLIFNTVTCDNEGMYTCAAIVGEPENPTAMKSSNTTLNVSCVDCGMPITNKYVVDEHGKTTFNSSLSVTCVDGLEFSNVSVKVVTCEADGNWHGEPDCEIPGAVSFTQTMYAFAEGAPENITCEVKDYPRWQTVLLAKADPEETGPINPIFMISNATGSVNSTTFNLNFTVDYTLKHDGVSVTLKFNTVTYDNEGQYTCATIVGEPENDTAIKSSNTIVYVSFIDCGIYEPITNTYVVDENGTTTFNSSLAVTCADGLEFSNVSAKVVTCEKDGIWHGEPDCEIPGFLSFTDDNYVFNMGKEVNVTCQVTDYPNWKTLLIGKLGDENGGSVSPIFAISNETGSVENTTFDKNYTGIYTLKENGASISLEFNPAMCDHEGLYICAAFVGEFESPIENKLTNTTVNISTDSNIPEITIPDKIYFGEEADVKCTGSIGKGESGHVEGMLLLETNFGDNGSSVTYNGSDTLEEENCYFQVSLSVPIPTFTNTSDLWAQCVVRPLQGDDLLSEKKDIHILSSLVNHEGMQFRIITKENNNWWHFDGNNPNIKAVTSNFQTNDDFVEFVFEEQIDGSYKIRSVANALYMYDGFNATGALAQYLYGVNDTVDNDHMRYYVSQHMEMQDYYMIQTKATGRYVRLDEDKHVSSRENIMDDRALFNLSISSAIVCEPVLQTIQVGESVMFTCTLEDITEITRIVVKMNSTDLINEENVALPYGKDEMRFALSIPSINEVNLTLTAVSCGEDGDYTIMLNALSATVTLRVVSNSTVPEITIPDKIYLGRDAEVVCTGLIGKGESAQAEGQLLLETNFGDNGNNITFNGSDTPKEVGCYFKHSISVPIPTSTETSDLWAQCVIRRTQGDDLLSEKKDILILTSFVAFRNSSYVFDIGNNALITCDVQNIPDWKRIEIRRFEGEVIIGVNSTSQSADSNEPHISLMEDESNFANDSATISALFDSVKCSDAMGSVGDIEYTCAVMTNNSTIEEMTTVTFQRKPKEPVLTMSREIIENKYTLGDRLFYCEGDVGGPAGSIEVQSNFNGSFETFLAPMSGLDNNTIGWIVINETDTSDCMNYKKIGFAFHNVTMDMQYKRLRCVIHPSENLSVTLDSLSDENSINIVPADICVGEVGYVAHPYFCDLFVECDSTTIGHIVGVPSGCNENECFNDDDADICVDCSTIGGCNITGIKCDKTHAAAYKSDTISFTCDTQDFGEVTHISINKQVEMDINATEMSIQVTEDVYLKVNEGYVILSFLNVSCDQEDAYVISLNNRTDVTLSLVVVSDSNEPNISVPDAITANQEMNINCSGHIGRDEEGNNRAAIYLEVMTQQSSEFTVYSDHETRLSSEENCENSETVMFSVTPNIGWNNSHVRCITKNDYAVVTYSSQKAIVVQTPALFCEPMLKTTGIAENVMFTCALKDITEITSVVVSKNTSELINEDNLTLPYVKDEMQFTLSIPSINEVNLTFTAVTCEEEGDYDIMLNEVLSATVTVRVVTPATEPSLNKPTIERLNERLEISCSGDIGRDLDGKMATNMSLEVKFANESEFSIYNENIEQDPVVLDNCHYAETIRLIFYPDVTWNNSEVRCVARNQTDVVQSSTVQVIHLSSPNTYFENTNLIGILGESVILTCIVENLEDLTDISITKGPDRTIVASYAGDSEMGSATVITESSHLSNSSGVLRINLTIECGDDGEYYCTPSNSGNPSEDVAVLSLQWKALTPILDPSSDMVENSSPWAGVGFETQCKAELGSQNASVYLESNINGTFKKLNGTELLSSEFNSSQCSNIATIKFDNTYTAKWNGTVIRCVVETEEEKLMDAEYVTVVPETFCDGSEVGDIYLHPYDCRARFTCTSSRITSQRPNPNCEVDECYDVLTPTICTACVDVGKCRPDPLEDGERTPTTPVPGTPYMSCADAVGWMNGAMSINCTLHNITIESPANAMVTVSNATGPILDTTMVSPSSSTNDEATYALQDGISIVIEATQIMIKFVPVKCSQDGDYKVMYNGTYLVQSTGTLNVQSLPTNPVLSKAPENDYLGSEMTISCSGTIGSPKGQMTLKTRESSNATFSFVTEAEPSGEDIFDNDNCTYIRSITHSFYVTSDMDGHEYICETSDSNGMTFASDVEIISVDEAAVLFTVEEDSAEVNTSKDIQCVLTSNKGLSGAVISWSSSEDSPVVEICRSDSSDSVTCAMDGVSATLSNEGTNKTITLAIQSVSCNDSGIYYCEPSDDGTIRSRMKFDVTREPSAPILEMQGIVIENIPAAENMTCIGHVGYPTGNRTLKIQFRSAGSNEYDDFDVDSFESEDSTCTEPGVLRKASIAFDLQTYNNTEFRCGLFENNELTPLLVSNDKTLLVLEYPCIEGNATNLYYENTFDCHGYIWCSSTGVALFACPGGTCANITSIPSTDPHCDICEDTCNSP